MKIRENLMLCRLGEEFVIVFADKKGDSPRDPIVLNQMESVFWIKNSAGNICENLASYFKVVHYSIP